MPITEWELTADAAAWINEITGKDRTLPFSRARCEQRPEAAPKRHDLVLLGSLGQIVVSGGIRLPYGKDGGSPFHPAFVNDARTKAVRVSSRFFFTWNLNECVLWETAPTRGVFIDRNFKSWVVAGILKENDLEHPAAIDALKQWLPAFLIHLSGILQGTVSIREKSPDEKIADSLESALRMPMLATLDELEGRCGKAREKLELDTWMSSDRGWQIGEDPETIRDNLQKAARFCCRGLLKKLVVHEFLLRRSSVLRHEILVPSHIVAGEDLRNHLEGYFAEALAANRNCESIFGEDRTTLGSRLPSSPMRPSHTGGTQQRKSRNSISQISNTT